MRQMKCPECGGERYTGIKPVVQPDGGSRFELQPCIMCCGSGQLNQDQYDLRMEEKKKPDIQV